MSKLWKGVLGLLLLVAVVVIGLIWSWTSTHDDSKTQASSKKEVCYKINRNLPFTWGSPIADETSVNLMKSKEGRDFINKSLKVGYMDDKNELFRKNMPKTQPSNFGTLLMKIDTNKSVTATSSNQFILAPFKWSTPVKAGYYALHYTVTNTKTNQIVGGSSIIAIPKSNSGELKTFIKKPSKDEKVSIATLQPVC